MRSKRAMASSTLMLSPLSTPFLLPKALRTIGIEDLHSSTIHDFHSSQFTHQRRERYPTMHEGQIQVGHGFGVSQHGKTIARHGAISDGHRDGLRANQGGQVMR